MLGFAIDAHSDEDEAASASQCSIPDSLDPVTHSGATDRGNDITGFKGTDPSSTESANDYCEANPHVFYDLFCNSL
ncbi:hypothetical protein NP233_g10718 [Leucocoprinus birnbaumii]|uniref:Uncharacterized protein n=1 Tax=Leucocoprinus birnbaumii TaxID=56174 RepID=A0AAD5YRM6_9AGAR|nr:hypothetical protein NP233_g10718 [Leucocoprinus birnbaumii]